MVVVTATAGGDGDDGEQATATANGGGMRNRAPPPQHLPVFLKAGGSETLLPSNAQHPLDVTGGPPGVEIALQDFLDERERELHVPAGVDSAEERGKPAPYCEPVVPP